MNRRRLIIVFAILTALLAAGCAAWIFSSRAAAQDVAVSWTLDCDPDTHIVRYEGEPSIASHPGWACTVHLTVANDSGQAISTRRIDAPTLGPHGAGEIQGSSVPRARLREVDLVDDAVEGWFWKTRVPAHSSKTIDLQIGWRATGCNSAGAFFLPNWPTVDFEVLGLGHHVASAQRLSMTTCDDEHDRTACTSGEVPAGAPTPGWTPIAAGDLPLGSPDDTDPYGEWAARPELPACGAWVHSFSEKPAKPPFGQCLRDGVASGEGAEAIVQEYTMEGEPIVRYIRIEPDAEVVVFTDASADQFSTERWHKSLCHRLAQAVMRHC